MSTPQNEVLRRDMGHDNKLLRSCKPTNNTHPEKEMAICASTSWSHAHLENNIRKMKDVELL